MSILPPEGGFLNVQLNIVAAYNSVNQIKSDPVAFLLIVAAKIRQHALPLNNDAVYLQRPGPLVSVSSPGMLSTALAESPFHLLARVHCAVEASVPSVMVKRLLLSVRLAVVSPAIACPASDPFRHASALWSG
jgi:hypothetical protein